jgi:hypothetical protein
VAVTKKPKARAPKPAQDESAELTRLVVKVPERIHRQVKSRAAAEGKTMAEYLLELLAREGIR